MPYFKVISVHCLNVVVEYCIELLTVSSMLLSLFIELSWVVYPHMLTGCWLDYDCLYPQVSTTAARLPKLNQTKEGIPNFQGCRYTRSMSTFKVLIIMFKYIVWSLKIWMTSSYPPCLPRSLPLSLRLRNRSGILQGTIESVSVARYTYSWIQIGR